MVKYTWLYETYFHYEFIEQRYCRGQSPHSIKKRTSFEFSFGFKFTCECCLHRPRKYRCCTLQSILDFCFLLSARSLRPVSYTIYFFGVANAKGVERGPARLHFVNSNQSSILNPWIFRIRISFVLIRGG